MKGLKVSPFNELENSKGVKLKPLIDRNNFVEKNKGIRVMSKVALRTKLVLRQNQITWRIISPEGVVSLLGDVSSSQKVKILRDTGATQSLMLDSVLSLTENSFTASNVLLFEG